MKIGIIGAGNLGAGLAKHLVNKGHAVMVSFSRDMEKLNATAQSLGTQAGSAAEAASFGEVVVLATPWTATADALKQIGKVSVTKILWDCTNALKPDMSGLAFGTSTSGGEEVAKMAPWAKVVKAIPPFAEVLHSSSTMVGGKPPNVFVCGDDPSARKIVARLVEDIGAAPVDAGLLELARYTEPAAMLIVQLAYRNGFGTRIGLSLVRETSEPALKATSR